MDHDVFIEQVFPNILRRIGGFPHRLEWLRSTMATSGWLLSRWEQSPIASRCTPGSPWTALEATKWHWRLSIQVDVSIINRKPLIHTSQILDVEIGDKHVWYTSWLYPKTTIEHLQVISEVDLWSHALPAKIGVRLPRLRIKNSSCRKLWATTTTPQLHNRRQCWRTQLWIH